MKSFCFTLNVLLLLNNVAYSLQQSTTTPNMLLPVDGLNLMQIENTFMQEKKNVFDGDRRSLKDKLVSRFLRRKEKENELLTYLDVLGPADNKILFLWNSSGILQKTSPIGFKRWLEDKFIESLFYITEPSKHGKVAILYNSDKIHKLNLNVIPPVPLMLYTAPDFLYNSNNTVREPFLVVPDPYDRKGFPERNAKDLMNKVGEITFTNFQARKNVIVWRGALHGEHDLQRKKISDMSSMYKQKNITWLDAALRDDVASMKLNREDMATSYKYQIDIGGLSGTSWEGLRWKMCGSGSLVFKVDCKAKDWWHPTIKEWVHYIPVDENLTNLEENYNWAEKNPEEAFKIAREGQTKCWETLHVDYVREVQRQMTWSLPASSLKSVNEANAIFKYHLDRLYQIDTELDSFPHG